MVKLNLNDMKNIGRCLDWRFLKTGYFKNIIKVHNWHLMGFCAISLLLCSCRKENYAENIPDNNQKVNYKANAREILSIFSDKNNGINKNVGSMVSDNLLAAEIKIKENLKEKCKNADIDNFVSKLASKLSDAQVRYPSQNIKKESIKPMMVQEYISYEIYSDLQDNISTDFSAPIVQSAGLSNNMGVVIDEIDAGVFHIAGGFIENIFREEGYYEQQDINLLNSNILHFINDYHLQINSLTNLSVQERDAINLALVGMTLQLSEVINSFPPSSILFNQIEQNIVLKSRGPSSNATLGLFSWIKKNIIKPIVTFVVTLAVVVTVMVVPIALGFILGGDLGALIGVGVGVFANRYVGGGVRRFLEWADLYDENTDIYNRI